MLKACAVTLTLAVGVAVGTVQAGLMPVVRTALFGAPPIPAGTALTQGRFGEGNISNGRIGTNPLPPIDAIVPVEARIQAERWTSIQA